MLKKIFDFLKNDIWRMRLDKMSRRRSFLFKQLRIVVLSIRGFNEDECQLKASALTFYSLLSIVPVVAMAFGIAKGFGFEQMLETHLVEKFPGQEDIISQVIAFAHSLLQNTKGGLIAGIGVGILFWTVVKVLGNIERAFNSIWGVKEVRSMGRKFSDYLSIMVICPVLFIIASGATVFIKTQVTIVTQKIEFLEFFGPVIFTSLRILPYGVMWILFTFVYMFMPNTKVKLTSGLFAGIAAGTIYHIVQWGYITFQIGAARYNAIYGSFAALPLFLIWLQLSWIVVLLGAEISFAHQNVDTYDFEPDCLNVSSAFKKLFSLRITELLVKNFREGGSPLTDSEISKRTDGPIRLVRQVLFELMEAGMVSEVNTAQYKETAYQPAKDIGELRIKDVLDALDQKGTENVPIDDSPETKKIRESLMSFNAEVKKSPDNIALKDV
jgi:membrane protein